MIDKRIDILRKVGETGSISQAARACQVSYKAAWQALDTMTNLARIPLVEKVVGGVGGGGARLTEAGEQLLQTADRLKQARREITQQLAQEADAFSRFSIQTSMRNYLPCHIAHISREGQIAHVQLAFLNAPPIFSRITTTSAELLDLSVGKNIIALCKATAVHVMPLTQATEALPNNHFIGTVNRLSDDEPECEIGITLAGNLQLVGFAPNDGTIKQGDTVCAKVEPAAIVLALAD